MPRLHDERLNRLAWNTHARLRLAAGEAPQHRPPTLWWTPWPGTGPGPEVLGDVTRRRAVELGCGAGDNTAALAAAGATVTGVDAAPAMSRRARIRWGHLAGATFVTADAARHLAGCDEPLDAVCSVFGALTFSPPDQLLPLIADRLRPGGTLAFSARLPPPGRQRSQDQRPLALPDGQRLPVTRYTFDTDTWAGLLDRHGFINPVIRRIDPPDGSQPGCVVVTTRNPG